MWQTAECIAYQNKLPDYDPLFQLSVQCKVLNYMCFKGYSTKNEDKTAYFNTSYNVKDPGESGI